MFQSFMSVWEVVSRIESNETRRGVHGWPKLRKFQRRASLPSSEKMLHGSMTLPRDLDIFCPSSSTISPRQTTFRYGVLSKTSVFTASSE